MSDYSYQEEYGYPESIPESYKGKIVFKFWFNDDLEFVGYELKKDKLKSEVDPIYFNKITLYCGKEKERVDDSDYKYYQLIRINFKNNKLTKSIVRVSLTQLKKRNRTVLFL
jgi:mannitol-1-phosphate/altronate dehydrogenase